jgi:glutamate--cysteine ligase
MEVPLDPPLSRQLLLDYFLRGAAPRERWLLGMEIEKLARDAATGRPLPYDGAGPSIRAVLEFLKERRGGRPTEDHGHLVGLDADWGTITLEPGGQVEWSSPPLPSLDALGDGLERHLESLREAAAALAIRWVDLGVDPVHPVADMPWMPRTRYRIMRDYLGRQGRLAHRMMTQTASIHCAFDYADPADWCRKFRAAALMAPVATALFANSARVDGRDSGHRSFRQAIWRETDPDRCGLPPVVFAPHFGIESWLDWMLGVPTLFRRRTRGLVPTGGVPFGTLMARPGCDGLSTVDWEIHASTIFTEVRSYTYIEVRSADLQPDERALTVPTFWAALLYDEDALDTALDLGSPLDHAGWNRAMVEASRAGLDGTMEGRPLRAIAERALRAAARALERAAPWAGDPRAGVRRLEQLAAHAGLELDA